MRQNKNKAVFLDRDGVINKKLPEHNYIKKWEEFKFLPNIAEAIRELNKKFLVIVTSNQRGVGRGMMAIEDLEDIHIKMKKALQKQNARIDGIYFCPHNYKDNCNCRKPKPGMLFKAAKHFGIDLSQSYIIGDSSVDIQAGKRVGCRTILISNHKDYLFPELKKKEIYPDYIAPYLLEAVKVIKKKSRK